MHGHLNVKFFKSIYNFKMNLPINKKFGNMCMVLIKKKITHNTTIAVLIIKYNMNVNGIP